MKTYLDEKVIINGVEYCCNDSKLIGVCVMREYDECTYIEEFLYLTKDGNYFLYSDDFNPRTLMMYPIYEPENYDECWCPFFPLSNKDAKKWAKENLGKDL